MDQPEEFTRFEPGDVVGGRYRIVLPLNEGGMGAVYEAEHTALGRSIALKTLLPQNAGNAKAVMRFLQEAKAAAAIGHPGIVEVFDLGRDGNIVYIAMELLEGEELADRIRREHPLSQGFVLQVMIELCDAVAAAHSHGIIHRDLKPANVFLIDSGRHRDAVKVLDFGLAKLNEDGGIDASITKTGEIFGTPLYMSPEQLLDAKDVDVRSDVYAIGTILFESLAGVPAFRGESLTALVLVIASGQSQSLVELRDDLSPQLVEIVDKAMKISRDDRYQSVVELRDDLESCLAELERLSITTAHTEQRVPRTVLAWESGPPAVEEPDGAKDSKPPAVEEPDAAENSKPPAVEESDVAEDAESPASEEPDSAILTESFPSEARLGERAVASESNAEPHRRPLGAIIATGVVLAVAIAVYLIGPWGASAPSAPGSPGSGGGEGRRPRRRTPNRRARRALWRHQGQTPRSSCG